jgi:hypothetical protein
VARRSALAACLAPPLQRARPACRGCSLPSACRPPAAGCLLPAAAAARPRPRPAAAARLAAQLRSRYEGALLLLLRHRRWGTPLLACSTHLFWNPTFPDVKAAQAAVLCGQIRAFLQQQVQRGVLASEDVAVVIGGDFNSLWRKYRSDQFDAVPPGGHVTSGVYRLLSTGRLEPQHPDHPYRRQPGGSMSEALQREELLQLQLDTAGLRLQSMHVAAHGRCGRWWDALMSCVAQRGAVQQLTAALCACLPACLPSPPAASRRSRPRQPPLPAAWTTSG